MTISTFDNITESNLLKTLIDATAAAEKSGQPVTIVNGDGIQIEADPHNGRLSINEKIKDLFIEKVRKISGNPELTDVIRFRGMRVYYTKY